MAEDRQVPDVAVLLGGRIGQAAADVAGQGGQQRPGWPPGPDRGRRAVRDRCRLPPPQRVADPAQHHVGDLRSAAGALPDPEQHLHGHQRGKPAQADLPALGHRRLGQLPVPLAGLRGGGDGDAPPQVMSATVPAPAFGPPGTRRHTAWAQRRQRPDRRVGQEPLDRHPRSAAEPPRMRRAQPGPLPLPTVRRHPLAPRDRAPGRARRRRRHPRQNGDLLCAHPGPPQPGKAALAQPAGLRALRGGRAAIGPAQRAAQQRMAGGQGQHPAGRIPARLGQERRVQHPGQPGGRPVQHHPGQHMPELPRRRPARRSGGQARCRAHRGTPYCSRGLGTPSTAARSRPGSGCT